MGVKKDTIKEHLHFKMNDDATNLSPAYKLINNK